MFPPGGLDPAMMQQMMNSPEFAGVRQMMQTPEMQNLIQRLTNEPSITDSLKQMQEAAMSGNLASVMQSMQGNPKVMDFVQQMGQQMFASNPMLQALQNPQGREVIEKEVAELQKDPELAELMKEMQSQGPAAMQKYWNDPEIIKKFSKYGERLASSGIFPGFPAPGAPDATSRDADQLAGQLKGASLEDGQAAGSEAAAEGEEEYVCLQDAVLESDLQLLKEVLDAGIEVDDADEESRTAFHFACGYGEIAIAEELIKRGANVNIQDNSGNTPLHYAAGYGQKDAVVLLLKQEGLDVNKKNNENMTPYQVAEVNSFKDIMELLPKPEGAAAKPAEVKKED